MTRNNATIGLFLAAAILGGAYLGTGVAPVAFGASVAPPQATAANWSLLGGIGAAIGGLVNLLRGGGGKIVTDVLADGKLTIDDVTRIIRDTLQLGESGGLGGGVQGVIGAAKKAEQVSAEAAIDLLAGFAAVRGDSEVSTLLTEVGARIKARWYGGADLLPDVSPAMILGLLRLNVSNEQLNPILDVIRGRLKPVGS